ncbi:hypothetical protein M9Y10_023195 [Tritrichomonas musculus]|uniref:EF-hand domain-containing protein n=1 Tax=Tritrichomonas musculus TaxID=1915356 RepID=A0ABR2KUD8_9EUKA
MSIEEQAAKIREEFKGIDSEDTGKIEVKDIGKLLENLDVDVTDAKLQEIITKNELKETDKITYDKFLSIYTECIKEKLSRNDFLAALEVFDEDHDGKITRDELVNLLDNLGESITQEDMNELVQLSDPDNKGTIEYAVIVDLLMKS